MNIFKVEDVEVSQITKLNSGNYYKEVTIIDTNRIKTKIYLFGKDVRDLIFRKE